MSGRILALCLGVVALTVVLSARLFEIQIGQGEIWAGEAARLVRSGTLLPYRRGSILDAKGRVLARDEATYRLELSYRDFRRNHVLGLVAHARSALEARAVPLTETLDELEPWALELAELTPGDLEEFAKGAALVRTTLRIPEDATPEVTLRERRASDVRFYIARLLGLTDPEARKLRRLTRTSERLPSYLEMVASLREQSVEDAREELRERVRRGKRHLLLLAERLDRFEPAEGEPATDPLRAIVEELEAVRSTVEDLSASGLFHEAAGFAPGRLEYYTLFQTIDVSWIARSLYWNEDRISEWMHETRRRWVAWRNGYAVPRLLIEYLVTSGGERSVDRFLDLLRTIYAEPESLEAVLDREEPAPNGAPLAVFGRLRDVFGVEDPPGGYDVDLSLDVGAGPDESAREGWLELRHLVDRIDVTDDIGRPDKAREWRVGRLRRALSSPEDLSRYDLELVAREIVPEWEQSVQDALADRLFAAMDAAARDGSIAPNGRLEFSEERQQLALESLRDVLRDYGDRSIAIDPHPSYEAVYLLTRFPEEYSGFRAVDARLRVRSGAPGDGGAPPPGWSDLASEVIGSVSAVGVDEMQRQRSRENRLRELRSRIRTKDEDEELRQLVSDIYLHDESQGVSGIEGEWDYVLRGTNGYRERRGLMDRFGRGRSSSELSHREDGYDVTLSLDADLQCAAEWMLEHPQYDRSDPKVDRTWFEQPVGAIVLLSSDGKVIVSASVPNGFSEADPDLGEERADRSLRIDRTLRKPGFLPPGSVFKPFVALWALDRLGLDPYQTVECRRKDGHPAEYGGVRCWNSWGHGEMDLAGALKNSCNCYFAWLGETYPSVQDFRDMAAAFGFGQPTGLRRNEDASGLFEEYVPELFQRDRMTGRAPRLAANGLAVVEATPMQVARATLALATGRLQELQNVVEVDGYPVPRRAPRQVDVSEASFARIRDALYTVANEKGGTAYSALNAKTLGVEVAVKTGSADLTARREDGEDGKHGSPKHTWVAGWVPPEDPKAVFVVFLDRAYATSSHTAVYVAQQFLRLPETRAWLRSRGVELLSLEHAEGGRPSGGGR